MDEYTAEQVLRGYERIERSVSEFAEQIPLLPQNENIEPPSLITCMMDACGLIDSLLREMTPASVTINGETKFKDDCNIYDFANLHAKNLDLPNTRSVLLVSPPRYLTPFEPWKSLISGGKYLPLPWWQNYNSLKHDRLSHIRKATLESILDAVCALHQTISRRIDMVPMMMRRGWFPTGSYMVDYILGDVKNGSLPDAFVIQTKLFAVPVGKGSGRKPEECQFPEKFSELLPSMFISKPEFLEFLGIISK